MGILTTAGKNWLTDLFDGTVTKPTDYFGAIGTGGATAESVSDTALAAEVETRQAATLSQPSANVNRCVSSHTFSAARTINECGLFTASTGGTCLVRDTVDIGSISVDTPDTLTLTIDITNG